MTTTAPPSGVAIAALVVAIVAVLVAAVTAAANIAFFVFNGARVKVTLLQGIADSAGSLWRVEPGVSWEANPFNADIPRAHLEVGIIRVENAGRTPVTIRDPAFVTDRKRHPIRKKRHRRSVSGVPLALSTTSETSVRIEAYGHEEYVFDVWRLIRSDIVKGDVRLQASVSVRGGKFVHSPRRHAWQVPKGSNQFSFRPWVEVSTETRLFRQLIWSFPNELPSLQRAVTVARIFSRPPNDGDAWTEAALVDTLRSLNVETPQIVAWDVQDVLSSQPTGEAKES